jgi:hypothetical protein
LQRDGGPRAVGDILVIIMQGVVGKKICQPNLTNIEMLSETSSVY